MPLVKYKRCSTLWANSRIPAAPSNYIRAGVPQGHTRQQKDDPRFRGLPLPIWPPHCHQTPQQKCQILTVSTRKSPCRSNLGRTVTIVVICQFTRITGVGQKHWIPGTIEIRLETVGRFTIPHGGTQKLPSVLRLCCEQCTSVVRRIRTIRSLESLPCFLWDINDILDSRYEFHVFVYNIRKHRGNFMWHNLMLM